MGGEEDRRFVPVRRPACEAGLSDDPMVHYRPNKSANEWSERRNAKLSEPGGVHGVPADQKEVVDQGSTSWNQFLAWLMRLEGLRGAFGLAWVSGSSP